MRTFEPFAILLMSSLISVPAVAQTAPPPPLDYVAVADSFSLPTGMMFGGTSGVAINSKGNIFVIHRGPMPLMEFDPDGQFIRGFGDGLFDRPHGLRIDAQDNIWATDVAAHVVYKFNPAGRAGDGAWRARTGPARWHDYGHLRLFNEPNEAVFGPQAAICSCCKGTARAIAGAEVRSATATSSRRGARRARAGRVRLCRIPGVRRARACSTSPTATTPASRCSMPTATTSASRKHPGTPCGLFMMPDQNIWLAHGHTGES